jgi:hypothetical protein
MNSETIEKLNKAKVGDTIETKKWIITVEECYSCCDCFFAENCNVKCNDNKTVDNKSHIFKRVKKEQI